MVRRALRASGRPDVAGCDRPRYALLTDVWGYQADIGSNVLEAVVHALRKKLGAHASMIETVRGVGYRLR